MGQLLSSVATEVQGLWREWFVGIQGRVLCLGLDGSGKTTMLYKLCNNETLNTVPTIGFNVETLEVSRNVTFTVWDIGGQDKIRALWKHYFCGSCGLLFVVDSNDTDRVKEAQRELHDITDSPEMRRCCVVVMANKQDLPKALSPSELTEQLDLHALKQPWRIVSSCAKTGEGITESVRLLTQMVKETQARAA